MEGLRLCGAVVRSSGLKQNTRLNSSLKPILLMNNAVKYHFTCVYGNGSSAKFRVVFLFLSFHSQFLNEPVTTLTMFELKVSHKL